jgi:putative heme-binding domain-containing protein
VLRRHPGWADQAAGLVGRWVGKAALSDEERAGLRGVLLAFGRDHRVQDLVADALAKGTGPARLPLLEAIAESPLPELPESWTRSLGAALADPAAEVRAQAVRTVATLRVPQLDAPLRRLAEDPRAPAALRLEALRAVLPRQGEVSPELSAWLTSLLDPRTEPHTRLAAAALLAQARLSDAERRQVLNRIRGDALLAPEAFLPANAEVLPKRDLAQQRGRLAELEPLLKNGDPARGHTVFFGERVGCSACHQVGGEGRQVGPDLTRVGAVRSGRDLIESLVFPAATFAQGFENYLVATTDGRSLGGVIARQTDDVVVLRDASGAETRVPKRQIDEMKRLDHDFDRKQKM